MLYYDFPPKTFPETFSINRLPHYIMLIVKSYVNILKSFEIARATTSKKFKRRIRATNTGTVVLLPIKMNIHISRISSDSLTVPENEKKNSSIMKINSANECFGRMQHDTKNSQKSVLLRGEHKMLRAMRSEKRNVQYC